MSTQENPFAKVIAQAWSDEDYKRQLLDHPAGALAEAGAEVPDGVQRPARAKSPRRTSNESPAHHVRRLRPDQFLRVAG